MPLPKVVEYATQVASALQYAHDAHLIHRDVKPENMLVRSDGTILLSDFGLATTAYSTHSLPVHRAIGGTLPYISPEQLAGKPRTASDQYALAVVMYEWIAGRTPFRGTAIEMTMQYATQPPPSLIALVPDVPQAVENVLFKALAKDYQERFSSIQVFIMAFQQALSPSFHYSTSVDATLPREGMSPSTPLSSALFSTDVTLPREGTSSPIPLPPTFFLPTKKEASFVPLSSSPISISQIEKSVPETPGLKKRGSSISDSFSQQDFTTPRAISRVSPPMPARRSIFFKKWSVLLIVLSIVLLIGGGYAFQARNGVQKTVVPGGHQSATVMPGVTVTRTTGVTATATVKTMSDAYDMDVLQHGIMFGFDAEHTRSNPYEHALNSTNVSHLHQAWVALTSGLVYSSPAIVNGITYVGSNDRKLYAFDAATGRLRWAALTGGQVDSAPAVANGIVYIGSSDGNVYAFDAITGQQKWTALGGGDSSPVIVNGIVYVGSLFSHRLYTLDAATGVPKWVALTGGSVSSSPAIANGMVYVGSGDHKFYAFSLHKSGV